MRGELAPPGVQIRRHDPASRLQPFLSEDERLLYLYRQREALARGLFVPAVHSPIVSS